MRKNIREIKVFDIINYFSLSKIYIIVLWIAYALLINFNVLPFNHLFILPLPILLTVYFTKRILIGAVLLYKAFAPLDVRHQCRFTPTCSTYMIIALKKYGLFIGLIKGILRIFRCKPPNGGKDYP